MLADGTYDVLVVDAHPPATPDAALSLELTVLAGEHKGEVVQVSGRGVERDPLDLLAVPGTLVVRDGQPTLSLEG